MPSADVLDKAAVYMEWDATLGDSAPSAAITPRSVNGLGHGVEAGLNVSSFSFPTTASVAVVPTVKWKFYDNPTRGIALFGGYHIYLPFKQRTYRVGDSAYVEASKAFKSGMRVGVGVYDFSAGVVDRANRGGVQASVEQTVSPRFALAADWYSGNNSLGYVTVGTSVKFAKQWTAYTAYEMGNHDLLNGNHALLLVLGWNPVLPRARR